MRGPNVIWLIVLALATVWLGMRFSGGEMARVYVRHVQVEAPIEQDTMTRDTFESRRADPPSSITLQATADGGDMATWIAQQAATPAQWAAAEAADPNQDEYHLSVARTFGIWFAALFTLGIASFLWADNALYKFCESVVVGVSAGYWMVVGYWDTLWPNLIAKLSPDLARATVMPGLGAESQANYWYIVPLVLGVMLLWRLAPSGAWISRWPLAFIIGSTAGLRIYAYLKGDFVSQIDSTITPLVVLDSTGSFDFGGSLRALLLVIGVFACLVYFFFSFEHKGMVGKTARLGIWYLMITFGAAFGYTVMGRIALLAQRLEFLFNDWLWLIDPTGARAGLF